MTKLNSVTGNTVLGVGHMAGAIDLAALPLWIGALMAHYLFQPEQAGLTVTAFLAAVVVASALVAPRFNRLPHRLFAFGGFAVSAAAFTIASRLSVSPEHFGSIVALHAIAGFGTGVALSVTHGAIGRTTNPHRLFGLVNVAMGVLAIIMFAVLPQLIAANGGQTVFVAFAVTMAAAATVSILLFPKVEGGAATAPAKAAMPTRSMQPAVWFIIGVVICLTVSQATVFSYVERIGAAREFGEQRVQVVLVIMGFVNLLPGALAALLQKRLSPIAVGFAGPVLQAVLAVSLTSATAFPFFAVPMIFYVTIVIFTHTFLFGLLSKIDTSGRAVAATPAMMMIGSATGPILGGIIVANIGYHGLGWAVAILATIAVCLMWFGRRALARMPEEPALAVA